MAEAAGPITSGVGEEASGASPIPRDAELESSLPARDGRPPAPSRRASPTPATGDGPEPEREGDGWLPL